MIHISKGNSKVGKIPNISIRPILDCGNCSACANKCYAMKAYKQYPGVRKAWDDNSKEFRKDTWKAIGQVWNFLLDSKIKKRKVENFRIHVAGDFLNQNHLDSWINLCRLEEETNFMANTKMFNLDYSNIPKNMHVRLSMWPGLTIPESTLPKAWLDDGTETRIPLTAFVCAGKCDGCLTCYLTDQDVVFKLH